MPAGPGPIGFAAFAGVKCAGYLAASFMLKNAFRSSQNVWKVGLVRTAIGLVFGSAFGGLWVWLSYHFDQKWPDWLGTTVFFWVADSDPSYGVVAFDSLVLRPRTRAANSRPEILDAGNFVVFCFRWSGDRVCVCSPRWLLDLLGRFAHRYEDSRF